MALWKSYCFGAHAAFRCEPFNYSQGGALSDYQGSSPAYSKHLQYAGGPDAIWKITDNLSGVNPEREADAPAWGSAEVMDNGVTQGLGLTPGRTFMLVTDIPNTSTSVSQFNAALRIYTGYPLLFIAFPYDPSVSGTWENNESHTRHYVLDINICSSAPPAVADAGGDRPVVDANRDGSELVTLDGSASSGAGGIVSYVWSQKGQQIATGATPQVTLDCGINDITLTVTDAASQVDSTIVRIWVYPAAHYFVDTNHPDASDSNPGTEVLPWKTLVKGVTGRQPGQVVLVKEGIYREQVSLGTSGSAGSPITVMAYPFHKVVLSGADVISGWTQCTQQQAGGNPNYANIYYADIAWKPTHLAQEGVDLSMARAPLHGRLACTGGSTTTLCDTVNRTEANGYWVGATVNFYRRDAGVYYYRNVTSSTSAGTLTLDSAWPSGYAPTAGADTYYLYNLAKLICEEGQWAVEDLGGGTWRVFAWVHGGGSPNAHLMDGSRRTYGISMSSRSYWTFDGLEVRHCLHSGFYLNNSSSLGRITIQNCVSYYNDHSGIILLGSQNQYNVIRRNTLTRNRYGMVVDSPYSIIEENDVGWNNEDGVRAFDDMIVRNNYIHHHTSTNHPDGFQTYNTVGGTVDNLTLENNLLLSSGQCFIAQQAVNPVFRNNIVIGSGAISVTFGRSCSGATVENNTILCSGNSLMFVCPDWTASNNILMSGNSNRVWSASSADVYSSDYNTFWMWSGYATRSPVIWNLNYNQSFAQYVAASGNDTHSYFADPLLENFPSLFAPVDLDKNTSTTATRLYVPTSYIALFAVGDTIEVDWDGVPRTVTSLGADYVEFTPGDAKVMDSAWMIANWQDKESINIDVRPTDNSPASNSALGGGDMGSSINLEAMMNGDFDGDGRRDVPPMP